LAAAGLDGVAYVICGAVRLLKHRGRISMGPLLAWRRSWSARFEERGQLTYGCHSTLPIAGCRSSSSASGQRRAVVTDGSPDIHRDPKPSGRGSTPSPPASPRTGWLGALRDPLIGQADRAHSHRYLILPGYALERSRIWRHGAARWSEIGPSRAAFHPPNSWGEAGDASTVTRMADAPGVRVVARRRQEPSGSLVARGSATGSEGWPSPAGLQNA